MKYENGEYIIMRTLAFAQNGNSNKIFVTIKDHYTWEVIINRAWRKLSEISGVSENDLKQKFSLAKAPQL